MSDDTDKVTMNLDICENREPDLYAAFANVQEHYLETLLRDLLSAGISAPKLPAAAFARRTIGAVPESSGNGKVKKRLTFKASALRDRELYEYFRQVPLRRRRPEARILLTRALAAEAMALAGTVPVTTSAIPAAVSPAAASTASMHRPATASPSVQADVRDAPPQLFGAIKVA